MVIEGVGGLLTRISLGVRVHRMRPVDGLRLSHRHKISDSLLSSDPNIRSYLIFGSRFYLLTAVRVSEVDAISEALAEVRALITIRGETTRSADLLCNSADLVLNSNIQVLFPFM